MKYTSKISSALLPALFACSAASLTGCVEQGAEQTNSQASERELGDVSLALELAPGLNVDAVRYTISGNGFLRTGTRNVAGTTRFVLFVGGIPAGQGYTIQLDADAVGQAASCTGSATFNVTAGQTSMVSVSLSCKLGQGTGNVIVDTTTNVCPQLSDLTLDNIATVGNSITATAAVSDLDSAPQAVAYTWTSTVGVLSGASSATPSLACTTVGDGTLTLSYTDGACAGAPISVPVHCVEAETSTDGGTSPEGGSEVPDAGSNPGQIRITEWMYDGAGGEWVELTNVGGAPVDMTGYSYDDDSALPGVFSLSGLGVVQPGESVVFTESTADAFRAAWALCDGVKLLGGYTNNLGRADQINIFDASNALVDRLTYGDQNFPGTIRTTGASGWVSAAGVGANDPHFWTLSRVADAEGSYAAAGGAIGSPGKSTRASVAFDPCGGTSEPDAGTGEPDAGLELETWPGSPDVTSVDAVQTFTGDLSGLTYEPATTVTPARLWAVENGNGLLYRLELSGGLWLPSAGWDAGKALRYPNGTGTPDSEGVTKAEWSSSAIYVATERNNAASGVSRPSVLRFDSEAAGATLTATHEWTLTADLPVVGANLGLEAISWIPDSFLTAHGFYDERVSAPYVPANYPDHGQGLFFVGLEGNGQIYAYALNHVTSSAQRIATLESGFPGIMGMEFDRDTGALWAQCDNTCQGRSSVLEINGQGRFAIAREFERPAGLPDANNEAFAIAPESECVAGVKAVFWADDDDTDGHSLRQGTLTCGPL